MRIQETFVDADAQLLNLPHDAKILDVVLHAPGKHLTVFYASVFSPTEMRLRKALSCALLRIGDHVPDMFVDKPYPVGMGRFFYVKEI